MQISGNVETLKFLLVLQKIKRKLVRVKIIEKNLSIAVSNTKTVIQVQKALYPPPQRSPKRTRFWLMDYWLNKETSIIICMCYINNDSMIWKILNAVRSL